MKRIRFTKEGYEKLKKNYEDLLKQRPAVIEDLQKARELGDLKENGYYKASRQKLSFIDSQLRKIDFELKYAVIITNEGDGSIDIGRTVTLSFEQKEVVYHIVGDLEADPSQGKISLLSPLGRALSGKKVGDEAHIATPARKIAYKIIAIT